MHGQRSPRESEGFARIDGAILGLLVNSHEQRPFADAEVSRDIRPYLGDVAAALVRLHQARLIHRFAGMVSATRAAVRFFDITQVDDEFSDSDRNVEGSILALLLSEDNGLPKPMSVKQIRRKMGAKKGGERIAILDALNNLDGIGLVDRSGDLAFASGAAVRFDQIMQI